MDLDDEELKATKNKFYNLYKDDFDKKYNFKFMNKEENKAINDLKRLQKGIKILNQFAPEKDDVDIMAIDIVLNLVERQQNEIQELKDEINEMWSHIPRLD